MLMSNFKSTLNKVKIEIKLMSDALSAEKRESAKKDVTAVTF